MTSFFKCPYFAFTWPLDCHNTFKIVYFRPEYIVQYLISSIKTKKYIFTFYSNFDCANPLTLKFMPGPRDNGGHLMEMHVFWYNGCNCGSTRCINMYTCGIRQRRAFVSVQHFGQSKVTSRSLQGQSFINSNKKNYTSQAILFTSG